MAVNRMSLLVVCVALFVTVSVLDASPHKNVAKKQNLTTKKPCCLPAKWETFISTSNGVYVKECKEAFYEFEYTAFSSDAEQEKMVLVYQHVLKSFRVLYDFKNGVQYTVIGDLCFTKEFDNKWDICLPEDSEYGGYFTMGAAEETLGLDAWTVKGGGNEMSMTFNENCVPAGLLAFGENDDYEYMSSIGYINATIGIKDPAVFDVPSTCKSHDHGEISEFKPERNLQIALDTLPSFHNLPKPYFKH